jgi:quercetin dioxygenase-like cupin family protein
MIASAYMKLFQFGVGAPITRYGSIGATATPLVRDPQGIHATWIQLEPGGQLGNHPAVKNQLFLVIQGEGWVQTEDSSRTAIGVGQAAFWQAGEYHTSGTQSGLVAIVLESDALGLDQIRGEPLALQG